MREFKTLLILTICALLTYSSAVYAEDASKDIQSGKPYSNFL